LTPAPGPQPQHPVTLLADAERSPVTTILCVGSIAAVVAEQTGRSVDHLVLTPLDAFTEPWRYVTTIFPHGGLLHLVFNVFWAWAIGRALEQRLGLPMMLGFVLVAALAASGTEVLMFNAAIGLSGVVYAFATFAWTKGRHDSRFRGIVDTRMLQFFIGWFFLCIVATESGFMRVANGAHAGGAIIGFFLGMRRPWLAPLFLAAVGSAIYVRLGSSERALPARLLISRAESALVEEQPAEALELYDRLFATGYTSAGSVYNYGVALHRLGRASEGDEWLLRAFEIDPQVITDMALREHLLELRARRRPDTTQDVPDTPSGQ
ncbi:MAG: rhomboid family intramembrane serine protease, partial [Planctomycetota bacterium]